MRVSRGIDTRIVYLIVLAKSEKDTNTTLRKVITPKVSMVGLSRPGPSLLRGMRSVLGSALDSGRLGALSEAIL